MNTKAPLLIHTPKGLYCQQADVYLDPLVPVERAVITHAHSDHARPGSRHYLTHRSAVPILAHRLGLQREQIVGVEYGETSTINGVRFSLHPAGHIIGSAQILIERVSSGERWVFSGDYKIEDDLISTPLEVLRCDTFISECTFGLPVFRWRPQDVVFSELLNWWKRNHSRGVSSVVFAYSLGKAQRILRCIQAARISPVALHSAVWKSCELLGVPLDTCERIDGDLLGVSAAKSDTREARFIIAPPSALGSGWLRRFGVEVGPHHELAKDVESAATVAEVKGRGYYTTANVSGWMNIRGIRKRSGVGCGFVISDHADFYGLKQVVRATGASQVYLNHGYTAQFGRYLAETFPTLKVSDVESLTG